MGGKLGNLTLPAKQTKASPRGGWKGQTRTNHRIVRIIIYVHSYNNIPLSLSFIIFTIKGSD